MTEHNKSTLEQANEMANSLILVKNRYQQCLDELAVSVRIDEVRINLKDIIENNKDYESLKESINNYINNELKIPIEKFTNKEDNNNG